MDMEWEGLASNVGIRFDLMYLGERYKYLNDSNEMEWIQFNDRDKYKFTVSPRLNISYAFCPTSVVHFSFDVQSQMAQLKNIFTDISAIDSVTGELKQGENMVSNPGLEPHKTISSEIGFQGQLMERTSLNVTAFLRQNYNYMSIIPVASASDENEFWYQYTSDSYGSSKGIELKVQRTRTKFYSAFLSYSFSRGDGTFSQFVNLVDSDEITLREFPLDWDIKHNFTCNASITVGESMKYYIPGTGFKIPFDDFSINVVYNQTSGSPFKEEDQEINFYSNNPSSSLHLKFQKCFSLSRKLRLKSYVSINNLLDSRSTTELGDLQYDPDLYENYSGSRSSGRQITTGFGLSW